jgi:hypothetical protein
MGAGDDEWIIQGNYGDLSVSLMESDGTELTRVSLAVNSFDAFLPIIERRLGRALRAALPDGVTDLIRAELAAQGIANRETQRLLRNLTTGGTDGRVQTQG